MDEEIKTKFYTKKDTVIGHLKEKGNVLLSWAIDHPIQASLLASFIARFGQHILEEHRNREEEVRRQSREYDPTIGVYYDLKRPLTNKEKLELSRRHKNGESIGDILESFGVI